MANKRKFDHVSFSGLYDSYAVSKEKYTKEEAIALIKQKFSYVDYGYIGIIDGYVRYGPENHFDDGQKMWWPEYNNFFGQIPVWLFHHRNEPRDKDYEYVSMK